MRWDGGIEPGTDIGLHYDSLMGKLIAWAPTRDQAVTRMQRALRELRIVGVESSREFHLRVLEAPEFRSGAFDIQWLERRLPEFAGAAAPAAEKRVAAVTAALLAHADRGTGHGGAPARGPAADAWREAARREALR